MQKVINYGSFLQAYGLRKLVRSLCACEVDFVDIIDGRELEVNKLSKNQKVLSILKSVKDGLFFEKLNSRFYMKKIEHQFSKDFFHILELNEENNSKHFSSVIIGSDEVFHCCQNAKWGFSTQLLGNVKNADNVFSYAASFGATTYDDIIKNGILNEVKGNLSKLSSISVRDENSKFIIQKILGKTVESHLDPVLISDFENEINLSPDVKIREKFLIVYSYAGRITEKKEVGNIKEFAKKKELKIYTIFCRYNWADKCIIPESPFQLLKIFRLAEYVVSDTFHGTIFSIISHRKFCTLIRKSNKEKMTSLLKSFNLEEHAVFDADELKEKIELEIDHKVIDTIREAEKQRSLAYIESNVR